MSIITIPKPNPNAKLQLLCLPFAGGGARSFLSWYKYLPDMELCPVAYPGREHRIKERPITEIDALLEELLSECRKVIRGDFAIFGHSMGSIVSYGLAKRLEEECDMHPKMLFVSAAAAPTRPLEEKNMLSLLSDDKFVKKLIERYDAIPDIILQDPSLMKIFMTIIRHDISIEEQYVTRYGPKAKPLSCDIMAFGGKGDIAVNQDHLMTWKNLTKGSLSTKIFPGDHFYLSQHPSLLFEEISKACFS
jgi:medium-chain acyl-[acyl-carrier-protein] hydrolase